MISRTDEHSAYEHADERSTGLRGLQVFRNRFFACLKRRSDALFELCDALIAAQTTPSPVHLSLVPVHRRGWGSLYAAMRRGRISAEPLRDLLAGQQLTYNTGCARVYAVDRSSWPRCDAECSPERGYYYHPSRHSAGQHIVAGWSYQLIVELSFFRESWVAPADARRISPQEDADRVAAGQVRALVGRLLRRAEGRDHVGGGRGAYEEDTKGAKKRMEADSEDVSG